MTDLPVAVTASNADGSTSASSVITVSGTTTTIQVGETTVLSGTDNGNGNLLVAQNITLAQTSTIQSLSFYVRTVAGQLRLGVYDATGSGGNPGTLKAQTAAFTPVTGWNTRSVATPVALPAGNYWLVYLPSSGTLSFPVASTGSFKTANFTFAAMPNTFPTVAQSGISHWSFYGTFTTSGNPPPPPPPPTGFPNATNTGTTGTLTNQSGTITVSTPGTVVQNLNLTGMIIVNANNVTIRNCKINAGGNGQAIYRQSGQGTKVLNCEMFGNTDVLNNPSNHVDIAILLDSDPTAEIAFCNIYHIANAVSCYNANIHDNYFHDFVDMQLPGGEDFHVDGVQTYDANGFSGLILRHNTIISISTSGQYTPTNWAGGTSCLISSPGQFGETIDNNLLAGGAVCLYGPNHSGGAPAANMVVTNNHFSTQYYPQGGAFGPFVGFDPRGTGFTWSGNVWHETGVTIPVPTGP